MDETMNPPVLGGNPAAFPQLGLDENEHEEVISILREFKQSAIEAARPKKDTLKKAGAALKCKLIEGDLLPLPSTSGNDKDLNKQRPQVYIPVIRQQVKLIYSQLKMLLFANNEDYFRIRAKTAPYVKFEEPLTNGLKYIFRQEKIPQKLEQDIYNAIWAGFFASYPVVQFNKAFEWRIVQGQPVTDPQTGEQLIDPITNDLIVEPDSYEQIEVDLPPSLDIESLNPHDFYIDPTEKDPERLKWVYCCDKKYQDILDNPYYINKDKLMALLQEQESDGHDDKSDSSDITEVNKQFRDKPGFIRYDLYYIPYLELKQSSGKSYRNMIIGVASNQQVVRFHPNMLPMGLNPVVFQNWSASVPDDAYSTGPVEDLLNLQKIINILYNYKLETMARIGNRFGLTPNVDLSNAFGVSGGVFITDNPKEDIVPFTGDYGEIASLDNTIGALKAEAQILGGAQNPFQGSSEIDYQKTATELQILHESSISILREVAANMADGLERVIERLMYMVADLYTEPIQIPDEDAFGQDVVLEVDFSVLRTRQFKIDITSANPSQSKQAQVNSLKELVDLLTSQPIEVIEAIKPVIDKIGILNGISDVDDLLDKVKQRADVLRAQQAGVPAPPVPGVPGPPAPDAPAAPGPQAA